MKCSPEFRKRVAEQAELARRGSGRGYTGQMTFTYGEVKWILQDLQDLANIEGSSTMDDALREAVQKTIDEWPTRNPPIATPFAEALEKSVEHLKI